MAERTDTVIEVGDARAARRGARWRRVGLVVLALPLVAALLGVFGPSDGVVTHSTTDTTLRVDHPSRSRSSMVAPMRITVRRTGGFGDAPVELAIDRSLVAHLDFQNWYPNPSGESNDRRGVVYEFDPPAGDELIVDLDARVGPDQWFSTGRYRVAVMDGARTVVDVDFRMTIWP